jgi:DNA-binding MarR family transcriptional regulator
LRTKAKLLRSRSFFMGPLSIRELARAVGVTHSAASQTAAQMARAGLLTLQPGADARQHIASLTARTRQLLPLIEAEWAATDLATAELPAALWRSPASG